MSLGTDTTDPGSDTGADPVFAVSDAALAKVLEIRAAEDDPDSLCLWVEVTGVSGVDYTYDLSFETIADLEDTDHRQPIGDLLVAIPAGSVEKLRGATLDLPATAGQGGLVLRNPNRPNPLDGVADLELTGDLPEKVSQLLEQSINPSLAAHGGWASLVGVDGTRVFLTMGGGCQGCSMSAATLVQGIQVAIKQALPEVTEVIDATDHTAGENPFYT